VITAITWIARVGPNCKLIPMGIPHGRRIGGEGEFGRQMVARHGAKFGHKTEQAIATLLSHRNVDKAVRAVGISPTTLLRCTKEPDFDAANPPRVGCPRRPKQR
jgi:hypothetical protein